MTLFLFKYCLPLLLGYTLFIGLAGRMNPFIKPDYPEERPAWFLGLWTGLSTALVLGIGLHMAYSVSIESARALLPPTALFLAALLLPGFAAYSVYRRHIAHEIRLANHAPDQSVLRQRLERDALWRGQDNATSLSAPSSVPFDTSSAEGSSSSATEMPIAMQTDSAPILAAFMDTADLQTMDTHKDAANTQTEEPAIFEAELGSAFQFQTDEQSLDDFLDETLFDEYPFDDIGNHDLQNESADSLLDQTLALSEIDPSELSALTDGAFHTDDAGNDKGQQDDRDTFSPDNGVPDTQVLLEDEDRQPYLISLTTDPFDEWVQTNESDELQMVETSQVDDLRFDEANTDATALSTDSAAKATTVTEDLAPEPKSESTADAVSLAERLSDETRAHDQTRRQLEIARKLLARLAPDCNSDVESNPDTNERSTIETSAGLIAHRADEAGREYQAAIDEERSLRLRAEAAHASLQQELVSTKADLRRSMSARAKALSTANKAIGFARQTIQVRALLEDELALARSTLEKRQATISSVIQELETVRERVDEKAHSMAGESSLTGDRVVGMTLPAATPGGEPANEPIQPLSESPEKAIQTDSAQPGLCGGHGNENTSADTPALSTSPRRR